MKHAILLVCTIVSGLVAFSAEAAAPAKTFSGWKSCTNEIRKFCAPDLKSDFDTWKCLDAHEKQLSKACFNTHELFEKTLVTQ